MLGGLLADVMRVRESFEFISGKKNIKYIVEWAHWHAMENGSKDRYFQANAKKLVPEGVEGRVVIKVKWKIPSSSCWRITFRYGILRSKDDSGIKRKEGQFVKITAASLKESHPHDIHITKEAPTIV